MNNGLREKEMRLNIIQHIVSVIIGPAFFTESSRGGKEVNVLHLGCPDAHKYDRVQGSLARG